MYFIRALACVYMHMADVDVYTFWKNTPVAFIWAQLLKSMKRTHKEPFQELLKFVSIEPKDDDLSRNYWLV